MIRSLIRAEVGRRVAKRVAGQNSGIAGAVIGAATPWLVRRALTPAGLILAGGALAAKAVYDHKKGKRERD